MGKLKAGAISAFNRLPFLDIDDKVLPQSCAINRYLAKQFGLAGKTPFEEARVDALTDQFKDYWTELVSFTYTLYSKDKDPEAFELKKKDVAIPARDKLFRILEKEYNTNGSTGFLVGCSLTWVDLLIADHMDVIEGMIPGFFNDFPGMIELKTTVTAIPKLREWLEKRPQTKH
ncbi:hypothetical protein PMAYCL1PPCAC_22133 [Pristionchus mayeri]|uniref:Glutathione S-transferase n=1 Tax=Pristionchus mayeri TaxID=1317129 RepID=A0AAN5CW71_9BILA|nr:hypothetical protein PMAYCL1PPCAC_22133 [Pristionchus mayeri]